MCSSMMDRELCAVFHWELTDIRLKNVLVIRYFYVVNNYVISRYAMILQNLMQMSSGYNILHHSVGTRNA